MSVHLDSGYCASFGLFHRTTDGVFSTFFIQKKQLSCKQLVGSPLPHLHLISQPLTASVLPSLFLVKFDLLSALQTLLLVAVLKYLFVRWWWVIAVGRRWGIGAHHHMGGARLCWVCWVCHGNPWVTTCHPVDPEALHTSWLLGNWIEEEKQLPFTISCSQTVWSMAL